MYIDYIQLRHTLHFSQIQLHFNAQKTPVTLILGEQSTGKSALIRNIFHALSWFPARYKDARSPGIVMPDHDIMHKRLQSKIEIQVSISDELLNLDHSAQVNPSARWQLYKTLNSQGIGISKVELDELSECVELYHKAQRMDAKFALPLIAYYPSDRFVSDIQLISKNNPANLHPHAAYDVVPLPFLTFSRFFEWFRDISDIEHAQTTYMLQQLLKQHHANEEFFFSQKLAQSYSEMTAPALRALNHAISTVFPDVTHLQLSYQPKLQIIAHYQGQDIAFQQLSNSLRNGIALIGDIVRRLCLLNPASLTPCSEGQGILLIDNIDHQFDEATNSVILQRLHQAFPQLQIIATGCQESLLNQNIKMQCLRLNQKKIQNIELNSASFDNWYAQRFEDLEQPQALAFAPLQDRVSQFFEEISQNLNAEEQQQLIDRLAGEQKQPFIQEIPE